MNNPKEAIKQAIKHLRDAWVAVKDHPPDDLVEEASALILRAADCLESFITGASVGEIVEERKSQRTFQYQPLSLEEFKKKFNDIREAAEAKLGEYDYWSSVEMIWDDLDVSFDMENYEHEASEWEVEHRGRSDTGFHELDNGLVFLGAYGGGDWEQPVFHVYYWDGFRFRGYVPRSGNTFNRANMDAYGNDDATDGKDMANQYPELRPEYEKLYAESVVRYKKEVEKRGEEEAKRFGYDPGVEYEALAPDGFGFDLDKIEAELKEKFKPRT